MRKKDREKREEGKGKREQGIIHRKLEVEEEEKKDNEMGRFSGELEM